MTKKKLIKSNLIKSGILYLILFSIIVLGIVAYMKCFTKSSYAADNEKMFLQANIEKYINYKISEQDKGTLIQYNVKTGIESNKDQEQYKPLKQSQIKLELNSIDGKYPYAAKIIPISTQATNGKTTEIKEDYRYNSENGTLVINASNLNENGDLLNTENIANAMDEYIVITYYDTYVVEPEEREVDIKGTAVGIISEDDRLISTQKEIKGKVKENIGELSSIESITQEIYNGNIKSNIINGTEYNSQYIDKQKIIVSKKEAQDKIYISEDNEIIKLVNNQEDEEIETRLENNNDLIYKSTKLKKDDIIKLLGNNGKIEILDENDNTLFTIDENTEFDENESIIINYENEIKSIHIKTSKIQNEGILEIENTKEIKSTFRETSNIKIKTTTNILGINEELVNTINQQQNEEERLNEVIRKIAFNSKKENFTEIKDSKTNIDFNISKTEFTNKEQNEILFDINLNSNNFKDNMFINPKIEIELPEEVEKVMLGDSHIIYGNGLELRNVNVVEKENGRFSIYAYIEGKQIAYNQNSLGLKTNINIPATIILKKDIENLQESINLICENSFTLDGNVEVINKKYDILIQSYKEENTTEYEDIEQQNHMNLMRSSQVLTTTESPTQVEGLTMEVIPLKGDEVLKNGDTVYEGEYIKYNIKVTNTSDKSINNIKVIGTIPEGTIYGELEADYNNYMGEYKYNYDENLIQKEIYINTIKPNETYNTFYEVRAKDLAENSLQQEIITNIKVFVNNTEINNYQLENILRNAEAKVFLGSFLDNGQDRWNYSLKVESQENKQIQVKLLVPEEFQLQLRVEAGGQEGTPVFLNKDSNNIITDTIETNKEYWYEGLIDSSDIREKTDQSQIIFKAIASAEINSKIYVSNENRIEYEMKSVSITMTSDNEGEEVNFEDEINYEIKVKNTGRTNYKYNDEVDVIAIDLKDYLPEEVKPISMEYEYWEETEEGWVKNNETKKINSIKDKDGNKLPNIDLTLNIPYNQELNIKIKTTAKDVLERTKIENNAIVTGDEINSKTSNTISHFILPYTNEIDKKDEPIKPVDPTEPSKPEDSQEEINPSDNSGEQDEKYSISGVAWLDENRDGQRQSYEQKLNGIKVIIVNSENSNIVSDETITDDKGEYIINDLEQGKYIVLFQYDTQNYNVTEYQKKGVTSELNSDASNRVVTLNGNEITVGATDQINLNASIKNVDIGLIKNGVCDLKLDKYISQVSVTTKNNTKQYSYNNEKLAKVEIKSKEINNANVIIEYKIVITNEGEVTAQVGSVIDYIPEGLKFSSELNKDWGMQKNGQLINNSLSNTNIKPGESVNLSLIMTKTMNSNATGEYINSAEIGSISNSLGILDKDSTSANKIKTEDDYSEATLILSISTGEIVYFGIVVITIIIMIIILTVLFKKGLLKNNNVIRITKITIFMLIFSGVILTCKDIVWSNNYTTIAPNPLEFIFDLDNPGYYNEYGSTWFKSPQNGWGALCQNAGLNAASGNYSFAGATGLINSGNRTGNEPEVNLTKENFENRS